MIDKAAAINSLLPTAQWTLRDDKLEWLDSSQTEPTEEAIQTELARLTYLEGINQYQRDRVIQYPAMSEQLDDIFHNGVDVWKANIQAIKDAIPKTPVVVADQNAAVSTHIGTWQVGLQAAAYRIAKARIAQYQLSVGSPESNETNVMGQEWDDAAQEMQDVTETLTIAAIAALGATVEQTVTNEDGTATLTTVANPLIVTDDAERAAAQLIVDNTPQPVKDQVNGV